MFLIGINTASTVVLKRSSAGCQISRSSQIYIYRRKLKEVSVDNLYTNVVAMGNGKYPDSDVYLNEAKNLHKGGNNKLCRMGDKVREKIPMNRIFEVKCFSS